MKYIFFIALVLLCSCSHSVITVGDFLKREDVESLKTGTHTIQTVLEKLGAPVKVFRYKKGTLYLYASFRAIEKKIALSYGQFGVKGKIDFSRGDNKRQVVLLFFDEKEVLKLVGIKQNLDKAGFGFSLGPVVAESDLIQNPFFEKYDYYRGKHLPIIVSLLNRYPGAPEMDAQDTKYLKKKRVQFDYYIRKNSMKRPFQKTLVPRYLRTLRIDKNLESLELSDLRWFEVKGEREKQEFIKIIPYSPNGFR